MFKLASYDDSIADIPGTGIHIYSVLMAISIILVVFVSWLKMSRRGIPTRTLEGSILIIVPLGLLGARLWYVLSNTSLVKNWIDVFAVWDGGMAIQGGVTTGLLVGLFIFYRASKKYRISMWVYLDCILPNILLGQAIGRWGNFFNQEVLGHDIGHPFSWLPSWMNEHLHYYGDHVEVYRQPLFLYESIISLLGWSILTFVVPKVGFWFSKKPWKIDSEHFTLVSKEQFKNQKKYNSIFFIKWFKNNALKRKHWENAYYEFKPEENSIKEPIITSYKPIKTNINMKLITRVNINIKNFFKGLLHPFTYDARPLNSSYNPNNYRVTYAGVSGALYFAFYGIIRTIIEPLRDERDIMMIGPIPTSIVVSILWIILGITLFVFAQFIASQKFRKKGWFYERQY